METFTIIAEHRESYGKSVSRRLRRNGKVPGVVYGNAEEAESIVMNHNEIAHHLQSEAFHSHILTLQIGKKKEKVVLKDVQHHAFKLSILHIDLQRIDEKEQLTMRVPLHFINEAICVGVKLKGGVISHVMTDLEITCLPANLPEYIEIDMAEIDIGEGIYLADINMPEGTEISALLHGGDPKQIVVNVHMPKVVKEVEEEEVSEDDSAIPVEDKDEPTTP